MKVIYIEVGKRPEVRDVELSLKEMQRMVEGHIEMISPFNDTAVIVCNDEGKIKGLPLNRGLLHPQTDEIYEIIAGNFFICDAPPDSEDFKGLSDNQVKMYMELFKYPEAFIMDKGQIKIVKYKTK